MIEFKGVPFSFDSDDLVLDKDGEIVACAMTMDSEEDAKLAQLFSAAPELLEALQDLLIRTSELDEYGEDYTFAQARAAITKALGETK